MPEILIIEDDISIHEMIKEYLLKQNCTCISAYSGTEALLQLNICNPDLILMDLMLPGCDGEEILESLRKHSNVPVIVLSAKGSIDDKVNLLEKGADDYITKPFALEELYARINVQLRKYITKQAEEIIQHNDISLLADQKTMLLANQEISLTRHEYKIMELLLKHPKRAFTKQEIYEYAWEDIYAADDKTISVHISNIRNKCENRELIDTIWGIGFKLKG